MWSFFLLLLTCTIVHTFNHIYKPHPPVLHTVGLPALCQLQSADSRLAPGGDVVVTGVSVEVPAEATHLVLQPLAHCDAQGVKVVVSNLDVLGRVDDDEAFGRGQTSHQPG